MKLLNCIYRDMDALSLYLNKTLTIAGKTQLKRNLKTKLKMESY